MTVPIPWRNPAWMDDAACGNHPDPDIWYPDSKDFYVAGTREALRICGECPVRDECFEYGTGQSYGGIYGGVLFVGSRPAVRQPPPPSRDRDRRNRSLRAVPAPVPAAAPVAAPAPVPAPVPVAVVVADPVPAAAAGSVEVDEGPLGTDGRGDGSLLRLLTAPIRFLLRR